ncbi:peptidylprolyl isomerase [Tissierella creatinophila]|uniref:peptidylprolyl isomerase n=1 Tax=Tissierella creatinophila DSM 6911 TaxID=1123403 RepID=A0A1U7M2J2_TISCR|nr:peptidylprolyl isomerase [Tissierella creatinophila]OLS01470.1 foldase protein PrsA 1 precursor [Tissierella creatinophila DSM 6911]
MKNFKNGKYIVLTFILLLAFSLTGCKAKDAEVVATVGDKKITQEELNNVLVERYGVETLNTLISEKIVELEVAKGNVKITSEEIDKELKNMEEQYGGKEALNNAMLNANLTDKDLKKEIEKNLSLKKLLEDDIKVTDEEIAKYYEENKANFTQEEQVNASHVLVETEDLAKEVREKLVAGEDIAKLAKEYSTDEGTKDNGGNLGFFGKGKMVESFDKAAFTLPIGEVSQPIKSEFGYHVIVVKEKKEAKTTSLEENKETIKQMLVDAKMPEAFNKWYSQKVEEHKITNKLDKQATETK